MYDSDEIRKRMREEADQRHADEDTAATFEAIIEFANKECDGHVVIMKFTTKWRVSFNENDEIKQMPAGTTLKEAYIAALKQWQKTT